MDSKLKISANHKKKINKLASLYLKLKGYETNSEVDYQDGIHPDEINSWNQALLAFDFFNNTTLYPDHHIDFHDKTYNFLHGEKEDE